MLTLYKYITQLFIIPIWVHFIGDSTTAAYLGTPELSTLVVSDDFVNKGFTRTTQAVPGHAWNQQLDAWSNIAYKNMIDTVHISIGINNMVPNLNINNFRNEFQAGINLIRSGLKPGAKIVLSLMIPAKQGLIDKGMSGEYFVQFQNDIRNGVFTNIDAIVTAHYTTLSDGNDTLKPEFQLAPPNNDGVHENTSGKIIWADAIKQTIGLN